MKKQHAPEKTRQCKPCEGGLKPYSASRIKKSLKDVPGWGLVRGCLEREFVFQNYYQSTAFVNAVAWIAHQEDHHPEISFGYKKVRVRYQTHAMGGISQNDFICAEKINGLFES